MKKMKITLAERIAALVVAIALLAGMAPDALLRVSAETENHEGMYTLAVCDAQGEPLAGAEISWVICDEAGNNEAEQEKKTSGEDGVCELGEISTALGETEAGVEKVYYKITGINKFGYIYSTAESQNIYEVEKADRNSHREIRLTEKEKGTLTGKIETTEGAALEHAEILIEPGAKTAQTDAEGKYTVEGLYVGETYQVSVSHDDYISPEPKSVTYAVDAACDFNMAAKTGDDSFVFTQTSPDALTYAEELKYTNLISGAAEGIKYVIEEEKNADGEAVETAGTVAEINAATGELSVKTAGSVTVKATDSRYVAFYTLTINRAAQPDIAFDENCPESLDKGLSYNMTSWITGGVETADVVYTIDPAYSEVAVVENGMLAAKGVGTFMLTAQRGKTDCYKESNAVSCEIKVELPSQKEIEISGIEDTITYSPSRLEGPITVQNKDGSAMEEKVEITYEIKSADNSETAETDVAEFVGEDGSVLGDGRSVTITGNNGVYIKTKKAGKFMLCVTKKVEDHKDVAVSKEIVVKRADRSYTWIDKLNITYGAASCELDKVKDDQNNAVEDGVTYTIEENDLGATIKDGVVYFSDEKTGTATITATAEKTDAYNEWKAECQLTVSWLDTPESTYILQADKVVLGEETWYKAKSDTGEVTLSAPEGYQISSEYKLAEDGWKDYIVYDSGLKNIYLRNKAGGITDAIEITEKIDIRAPENLSISYESENGTDFYHKNNVSVTLVAKDSGSGIESFVYRLDTGEEKTIKSPDIQFNDDTASYTFRIPAQYAGKISFKAVDRVGNSDNYITEDDLIVDNLAPEVDITYSKNGLKLVDAQNNVVEHVGADTRFIYNQAVTAKITIKENNFDEKKVKLKINGVDSKIEWKAQGVEKEYVGIFELNQDGTYKVTFECEDKSGNTMKWKSDETDGDYAEGTYTSHEIVVDTKKPEIAVAYDDKIKPVKSSCYDTARTATITITEANFDASKVNVAIAAKNISGKAVSKENEASISSWETDKTDASIHTATVTFPGNAVYTLDISGEDIAGNKSNPYGQDKFTVDHSAPKTSDMKITYDKELKSWEKVVNKVTFGYYAYRKGVTVTLTAKDDISGIDKMKWTYLQEDGSSTDKNVKKKEGTISGSSITYSSDGITATASFKLTASEAKQFRGTVSFTATDRAGNTSKLKQDGKRVNVVDTITPKRTVSFTPAKQIVNGKMYYDGPVTAAFQITEANFYSKDVVIRVNGKKKTPKNWKQDGDTWTGSIKISGDGEYVVTATYKDRSGNRMKKYTSKKIVIDTKDPVIKVAYGNKDSKNTEGGTKYFDDVQTASITIREKNFRAKDVKVKVTAKDINGKDVSVMNYASYLSNKKNWKKNGDTYTAQISFTEDANYTFDIECQDPRKASGGGLQTGFLYGRQDRSWESDGFLQ